MFKIGFIGEFNSGKSTLINNILGIYILDIDSIPTKNLVYSIEFSQTYNKELQDFREFKILKVSVPLKGLNTLKNIQKILEAPGLGRSSFEGIFNWDDPATNYVVENSDVIFLVIEASSGGLKNTIYQYIKNRLNKKFYIIINKIDLLSVTNSEFKFMIRQIKNKLSNFPNFKGIITTSALEGNIQNLKKILKNL